MNEETKEAFVVDPADGAEQIEAKLAQNQWTLKGIVLTHGHFDHIGAVEALRNAYQVPVWAAEAERELLSDVEANLSGSWTGRPIRVKADHWLQDSLHKNAPTGRPFPNAFATVSTSGSTLNC